MIITKKRVIFIILLFLVVLFIGSVLLFVFIPPRAIVLDIQVTPLQTFFGGEKSTPKERVWEILEYAFQNGKKSSDISAQCITDSEFLPSEDPYDYSMVTLQMTVKSRSIWKSTLPFALVDSCNNSSQILICVPAATYCVKTERFVQESKMRFQFYIFTKDKTEDEIEEALHSIILQIPYSNRVHSGDSIYVDCKGADIIFK